MAQRKIISVILIFILIGFISAENSESTKDDGTEDAEPPVVPAKGNGADANTNATKNVPPANAASTNASTKVDAKSEKLCFLIKFHLQFNLTFQTIDDKAKNVPYNITEKDGTNVTRSCADGQSLTMSWGNNTSSITFKFKQNVTDTTYMLSNIDISIDVNEKYPEAKAKQIVRLTYTSKDDFKTPIGKSTSRGQPKTLQFKSSGNEKVDVILSNVQLEAYRTSSDESFSTSLESSTNVDNGSTIVIAIVCPLLLILALALIIGFVWRRRQGRECCFTPTGSRD
ncbi:hypothetical protein HA402_013136 [Bradysia odoriphaga]|nr:hypothetical protein HA402_013136 [Bradysia odoriphaga]